MEIYVDESGSFAEKKSLGDSWNVVASYVIPDHNKIALSDLLKRAREQTNTIEPKTKNFKHVDLLNLINNLKNLGGTLFAAIINTSQEESQFLKQISSFDSENFEGEQLTLKDKQQLILQANLFLELLNSTFWGAWIRYGKLMPIEVQTVPEWFIDQKCKRYEDFIKHTIKDFLIGEYANYEYTYTKPVKNIVHVEHNGYAPPITQRLINANILNLANNKKPNVDISPKDAFNKINFLDSKKSDGIQIAGILAGAIRGCLMNKYDTEQPPAKAGGFARGAGD
jgi:Protein of unknown function (DUF3800)